MILDTNAISALFGGDAELAVVLDGCDRPFLPAIAIGEYRYGLLRSCLRGQLEPLLETLIAESWVLAVDNDTTREYAEVRRQLRNAGRPIPENDVGIAALSRQPALPVVSLGSHFDSVRDLVRITW